MNSKRKTMIRDELAHKLGIEPERIRLHTVTAQLSEMSEDTLENLTGLKTAVEANDSLRRAAGPLDDTGRQRMLKVTAWIAHGGPANANGDAFLEKDLESAVEKNLFQAPYFGMMDFNHDFEAYGVWYDAKYGYDSNVGEFGILAEGAMFAWRYTDLADKMLAEQSREGTIKVSMAALPESIERREAAGGREEYVLRNPVFVATSLLDQDPADKAAHGLVTEGLEPHETRSDSLGFVTTVGEHHYEEEEEDFTATTTYMNAALFDATPFGNSSNTIHWASSGFKTSPSEENDMDYNTLIAEIRSALGDEVEGLKELLSAAEELPAMMEAFELSDALVKEQTEEIEGLRTELEEHTSQVETLETALEAQVAQVEALQEEITALTEELNGYKKAEEEAEAEALYEQRVAALPAAFVSALEERDEESRERVMARILAMSDEEFAEEIDLLSRVTASTTRETYVERSDRMGVLPHGGEATKSTQFAIEAYV